MSLHNRWRGLLAAAGLACASALAGATPASAAVSYTCPSKQLIGSVSYCQVPLTDLAAGRIPTGWRIVTSGLTGSAIGRVVSLGVYYQKPCPPDMFCGQTLTYVSTTADFRYLSTAPAKNWQTRVWGTSSGTRMTAAGYTLLSYYDPSYA